MASEHGVPVVFEPLGIDEESQQSFSKPNSDTTTPAPSPDTPNQASKPEPPSPPNTTQVSDIPTSQTQTPYEDPEIAPSRPNIPLTPQRGSGVGSHADRDRLATGTGDSRKWHALSSCLHPQSRSDPDPPAAASG